MFEKFRSENLEAFRQRYEGTYGFYRSDDDKVRMLVRLQEISPTRCTFINSEGIEFHLNVDSKREIGFEFLPPRSAWYNTRNGAVYTHRLAQRQFSRGITSKNVSIVRLREARLSPERVDFPALGSIFNSDITREDAFKGMAAPDCRSFALSSSFALDPVGNQVFLFSERIGLYTRDGNKFKMKLNEPDLWKVEIKDALQSLNCTLEV